MWSARFVVAMLTNFFTMTTFYILLTTMALYAVDRFNANDALAGLASGAFVLGSLLSRLITGKFLDFIGRQRLLAIVLAGFFVLSLVYLLADSLGLLIGVRFVHGMMFGGASTTLSTCVVSLVPRRRRGEGIGYYGMAMTAASAFGPFIGLALQGSFGYEVMLLGGSVSAAVAAVLGLLLRPPERTPGPAEIERKWRMHPKDFIDADALPIAIVMALLAMGYSSILAFVNSYGRAEDMVTATSVFFFAYAIALGASRLTVGRLQDRRGDNTLFYPAMALFGVGMAVLAAATNVVGVIIAAVCVGFGYGSTLTGGQAIAVTMAPEARAGVAVSTYLVAMDVGVGFGPVLLGLVIPLAGYRGMYWVVVALIVVAGVLYRLLHGYKRHGGMPA